MAFHTHELAVIRSKVARSWLDLIRVLIFPITVSSIHTLAEEYWDNNRTCLRSYCLSFLC